LRTRPGVSEMPCSLCVPRASFTIRIPDRRLRRDFILRPDGVSTRPLSDVFFSFCQLSSPVFLLINWIRALPTPLRKEPLFLILIVQDDGYFRFPQLSSVASRQHGSRGLLFFDLFSSLFFPYLRGMIVWYPLFQRVFLFIYDSPPIKALGPFF